MNKNENILFTAINKCIENAEELISDADYLLKDGRLPRAYTLYQLGTEEVGKAMRIFASITLGLIKTDEDKKKLMKSLKDHQEKAQTARSLTMLMANEINKTHPDIGQKMIEWTLQECIESDKLNDYKNYSLYTSFVSGEYKMPKEVISAGNVNYIELMSKNRLAIAKGFLSIWLNNIDYLKQFAKDNHRIVEEITEIILNINPSK